MSDQNPTTPDPSDAVPGYEPPAASEPTPPSTFTPPPAPPAYSPPSVTEPPAYTPPAGGGYEPPAAPPAYTPPAAGGYEPPAAPPAYTPPAAGGYPPPPGGGFTEPAPGAYLPPAPGYPQQPGYADPNAAFPPPPGPAAPATPVGGRVDIGTALSYGWRKFAANPMPFVLLLLISSALSFLVYLVGGAIVAAVMVAASSDSTGSTAGAAVVLASILFMVVALISVFVALVVNMGLQRAAIDTVRGRAVSVGSSFRRDDLGQYLALWGILVGALLVLDIVLSFIPVVGPIVFFLASIAAGVLFFFAPYLVLDRRAPAMEALKSSYAMAMANLGQTILIVLVVGFVGGIGVALCGLGAFVTMPLAMIAGASMYLSLQGESSVP